MKSEIERAWEDFSAWEAWLSEACDGLLDDLDMEQKASLYAAMCDREWSECPESAVTGG